MTDNDIHFSPYNYWNVKDKSEGGDLRVQN